MRKATLKFFCVNTLTNKSEPPQPDLRDKGLRSSTVYRYLITHKISYQYENN